ncbi:hypothetical protein F9K91_06365 [Brucella tritici]|uniref:Uncharacterized protein n=1 Tax=Brucella tritici TaxID=94626 RepID=A0A833CLM0_9HYPH|nr:hypothetical protein F9K91_06365 [Brucella tritici]
MVLIIPPRTMRSQPSPDQLRHEFLKESFRYVHAFPMDGPSKEPYRPHLERFGPNGATGTARIFASSHFPTQNRFALLLEMLQL